jgi:hypothetical protein
LNDFNFIQNFCRQELLTFVAMVQYIKNHVHEGQEERNLEENF